MTSVNYIQTFWSLQRNQLPKGSINMDFEPVFLWSTLHLTNFKANIIWGFLIQCDPCNKEWHYNQAIVKKKRSVHKLN